MKYIIIIYASKSRHTKQYVQWLQNELDAEVCSFERADASALSLYKLVVFASAVYNDKLIIMDYIKKNLSELFGRVDVFVLYGLQFVPYLVFPICVLCLV